MSAPTLEPAAPDFDVLVMLAAKLSAELDEAIRSGHRSQIVLSGPERRALEHVDSFAWSWQSPA